jgi:hypothetical protein
MAWSNGYKPMTCRFSGLVRWLEVPPVATSEAANKGEYSNRFLGELE